MITSEAITIYFQFLGKSDIPGLFEQIRLIFQRAEDFSTIIYHENIQSKFNGMSLPDFKGFRTKVSKDHVTAIIQDGERTKFRLAIFPEEIILQNVDPIWLPDNKIYYLIELIIKEGKVVWTNSENHYSAKVYCSLQDLLSVIVDIFLDIIIENGFSKKELLDTYYNKNVSSLKSVQFFTKAIFINNFSDEKINEKINYYPFTSLFKKLNISLNTDKQDKRLSSVYDANGLLNFWETYLLKKQEFVKENIRITQKENLAKSLKDYTVSGSGKQIILKNFGLSKIKSPVKIVKSVELFRHIPQKLIKQINTRQVDLNFLNECESPGFYVFYVLVKSQIDRPKDQKKILNTIFWRNPKMNSSNFIPLSNIDMISPVKNLLYTILFEKI